VIPDLDGEEEEVNVYRYGMSKLSDDTGP